MPPLKIGIQLASLRQPFKKALRTAARLGARAVEIDARTEVRPREMSQTGLRHLRKTLGDLMLQVSAVSFPTRRGYDVPDDLERRLAATQAAMRMANQLGASVVVNAIGRVPDAAEDPRWQTLREALAVLGAYGQRVGALLAARTGTNSGADLARLLTALPEGSIGADLDPGQLIVHGHSPLTAVEALGPAIVHVHATDAVLGSGGGLGTPVEVGRGSVDFPALLGALDQCNYQGWLTVADPNATDPTARLGNAVQYLQSF